MVVHMMACSLRLIRSPSFGNHVEAKKWALISVSLLQCAWPAPVALSRQFVTMGGAGRAVPGYNVRAPCIRS